MPNMEKMRFKQKVFTTFLCLLNTPTAFVIDIVFSHSHQLRSNSMSISALNMNNIKDVNC